MTLTTAVAAVASADSIEWLGVSPTGLWSSPIQWESSALPGADDVAVFPDYGGGWVATADISPSVAGVLLLDPFGTVRLNSGRTLTILDDPSDVNGFLAVPFGTLDVTGGSIVIDDSINGGGGIDLDGTLLASAGTSIDAVDFDNTGGTLRIEGRPGLNSTLTLVQPFTNRGLFQLDSTSNGFARLTASSAPVTNLPGATVQFLGNGSSLTRSFRTDLDSTGTVAIEAGANVLFDSAGTTLRIGGGLLSIAASASLQNSNAAVTFELDGGSVQNAGLFQLSGNTLSRLTGGVMSGEPLIVFNGDIEFPAGSTAAGQIEARGSVDLTGDVPLAMNVEVLGVPGLNTVVTTPGGDILGTVRLDSTSNGFARLTGNGPTRIAGDLRTFGGGSVKVRQLHGDFENDGTVVIGTSSDTRFEISGTTFTTRGTFAIEPGASFIGSAGTTFELDGGSFIGDGLFDWTNGTVRWFDGTIDGEPWFLSNCELLIDAAADGPAAFVMDGPNGFTGDVSAGRTLTVLGIPGINTDLVLRSDTLVEGVLEMDSTSNGQSQVRPETPGVQSITIGSGGELRIGGGGSQKLRIIQTDLFNDGTFAIATAADVRLNAGTLFETTGTMTIGPDADFSNSGTASTLRLVSGTISGDGAIAWSGAGRIELFGGTVQTAPIDLSNGSLFFAEGGTPVASIVAWGAGTVEGDIPATAALRIEGRPGLNSLRTFDEGAEFAGVLQLRSTSNGFAQITGPVGTGIPLLNSGTLVVEAGGSQPLRQIQADLRNEGLIRIDNGTDARLISGQFVNAGLFVANGPFSRNGGGIDLTNELGGTVSGSGPIGTATSSVISGGTTNPGDGGPGILTVNGDWQQTTSGRLLIEYRGETPGDDHDELVVGGTAFLGGRLDLRPIDDHVAKVGDTYRVLSADAIEGTFDDITCPDSYQVIIGSTEIFVVVIDPPVPGDLDCDGSIGFADLLAVLAAYGPCAGCPEDLDGSGEVDFADILLVLAAFG